MQVVEQSSDKGWRYHLGLCRGLRSRGIEVEMVNLSADEEFADRIRRETASFVQVGEEAGYLRSVPRLRGLIHEANPALVHAQEWHVAGWTALALLGTSRPPLIYGRHHSRRLRGIHAWLEGRAVRRASLVTCPSEATRTEFLGRRPDAEGRTVVLPNGIDLGTRNGTDGSERGRSRGGEAATGASDSRPFRIGVLGRLAPGKGHRVALRALQRLLERGEAVELLIAGTGPEEEGLRARAREAGLTDRVGFLGWVDDVASFLGGLDLLWVPSLNEAFGLTAVEGMAAGVPVVASDVGGLAEVIEDGDTGWLVPPERDDLLAERTSWILGHPDRVDRVVDRALEVYRERYTTDAMAERVARHYRDVVGSGAA